MKGLILAGGLGKRLRPLTHDGPKQLIPIANKPVLHHIVEDLVNSGITDIGVIVGYTEERINAIKDSLGNGDAWGAKITYIEQDAPRGLAHAVGIAKDFIGDNKFVVYLGDNIISNGIKKYVDNFISNSADASLLLSRSENPEKFGVATLDENKRIIEVEEKPKNPKSNLIITGIYFFNSKIFNFIKDLKPSERNELEITHAIQGIINADGHVVTAEIIDDWWDDAGTTEDILHANQVILGNLKSNIMGVVEKDVKIIGEVEIGKGTTIKGNSILRGPIKIGKNCKIENVYIGPYTSIADNTKMNNGEIESSIILGDSEIDMGGKKIVDSLIGKRTSILPHNTPQAGHRFIVGEDSEIRI